MVGQASFQGSPSGAVERDGLGTPPKACTAGAVVDVIDGQGAQFRIAGAVDEGEQAGQGLVRVDAGGGEDGLAPGR